MSYRYEQVQAYEVARELINSEIADCSAAIGVEEEKAEPNQTRIEELQGNVTALVIERGQMDMMDDAAVSAIIAKYRREPGRAVAPQAQP